MVRLLLGLMASVWLLAAARAAPLDHLPALKGDYFALDSKEVGRRFHIYVRLPQTLEAGKKYPVVYALDGDSIFPMLAPLHLFLNYDEGLPEAIVVGIAYGTFGDGNHRSTDYTAPAPGNKSAGEGAPAFHAFLEKELIPEIERRFPADPERRILIGQSRGGHFVLYSAFAQPDVFWARIASNAALAPTKDFFFGRPAKARRKDLRLFYSSASRDRAPYRAEALEWFAHWDNRDDAPWTLKTVTLEGETHAAGVGNVYRAAMLWLFEDELAPQARR
jgi:hypothetical protein